MTTLKEFQALNPEYKILTLDDPSFNEFGVVYHQYDADFASIETEMDKVQMPSVGMQYVGSNKGLEAIPAIQAMSNDIFAGMPTQAGQTIGHANSFSAIEFHQCSELNVMMDDVIMVLGRRQNLEKTGSFNPNTEGKIYYMPKGTVVEIYNDTLHYAPIEVTKAGFKVIVILITGTNDELPDNFVTTNKRVVKKGKFQVVHESRTDKIAAGAVVGVTGKLIELTALD